MARRSKRLGADARDGTSQLGRAMPALATDHVAVDERGRMRPDALRDAIQGDIDAGAKPFCINATTA